MFLTAPLSLSDVVADGFLTQAGFDDALKQRGTVTKTEFNPRLDGYEVVLTTDDSKTHVFSSHTVAYIDQGRTTWKWKDEPQFRFLGTWPSDDMIKAARTLAGNGPCFLVPQPDGSFDVAVLDADQLPKLHVHTALCVGLANMPATMELERALTAFGATNNIGMTTTDDKVTFDEGTVVDLATRRVVSSLTFANVVADAFYFSTEHQMYFEGRYPGAPVMFNPVTNSVIVADSFAAHGLIVGRIKDGVWQWEHNASLRKFALDYAILEFLRDRTPVAEAAARGFDCATKRILKHWTHVFVRLDDDTTALVIMDAHQLRLPPASPEATLAVMATPLPKGVDKQRAKISYHQLRNS